MNYYLAPLEGITTYTFRSVFHAHYGGMEKYFTPFIASTNLSSRERNDILPEHNEGQTTIPQILAGRSEDFLKIAASIAKYGYDTVNLNLGCPAPTVVTRRRGSGMLADPDGLRGFLEDIFQHCPMKISIKTRIGIASEEEWEPILEVFKDFPMEELIIHPRFQKQGYGGKVNTESFLRAQRRFSFPICYNGDITSIDESSTDYGSLGWLKSFSPTTESVMLGRGLLMDPGMVSGENTPENFRAFHEDLLSGYTKIMSGDANTLFKMKDLWTFFSTGFEDSDKYLKAIRKATRISQYEIAVNNLFRECRFLRGTDK